MLCREVSLVEIFITSMKIALVKSSKEKQTHKMHGRWLYRLLFKTKSSTLVYALLLLSAVSLVLLANHAEAGEMGATEDSKTVASPSLEEESRILPANHRIETSEEAPKKAPRSRQGRQYDAPLSASSTGSYASISGDGAYVGQVPINNQNYGSGSNSVSSYGNDLNGAYHAASGYHDPLAMARGYPPLHVPAGPMHHATGGYPSGGYASPFSPLGSMFSPSMSGVGNGLLSGSMFPLMSKGFDVSEIVCTAVAVAIGAVIIGAPFILIYLFVMNQMNGNGPNGGPSGGAISLTGPTSSTTVNGRKKRQTSLPEALFKQLSPLVNNEQVAHTFKVLMNSLSKYQM